MVVAEEGAVAVVAAEEGAAEISSTGSVRDGAGGVVPGRWLGSEAQPRCSSVESPTAPRTNERIGLP